jgi:predicted dehydrogenase
VRQCAAAGKPVYVEKPMAMNADECQAMIDACREAGVPLFTAYYRRALPRFLKVKSLIDDGAIGEVRAVNTVLYQQVFVPAAHEQPWRVDPAIAGGGIFVDMGCHTLDLLDYILGPIARVSGGGANQAGLYAAEDIVTTAFEFASGVRGTGVWCFSGAGDLDRTEIVGTRGRITFASFANEPVRLDITSDASGGGTEVFTIPHPAHVQQPLIQTIVDELRGTGTCPSTGPSAMRTTRVIDDLLRGYYESRTAARRA